MTSSILAVVVFGYFVGAIPFGVIICRMHGVDIFQIGSKSIGATNVVRAVGAKWGALALLLDVLKGVAPVLLARQMLPDSVEGIAPQVLWFVCGLSAVLGHCLSIFIGFKGGKGIATALGVGLAACPAVAGAAFGIFLIVFMVTRYVSLSSMVAVVAAAVFGWLIPNQAKELAPLYGLVAIFVIYRHRANIGRLKNGTEPKFNFKKKSVPDPSKRETSDENGESRML